MNSRPLTYLGPARRLVNSTSVLFSSHIAQIFIRFGSNAILARLLYPEAFGILMLVTSIMFIGEMLSDMGFTPFIIRHENGLDPKYLDTLFTMQVVRGFILGAIFFLLANPLADWMGEPLAGPALQVAALSPVIRGFLSFGIPIARRQQKEWKNSTLELVATILRVLVVVVLAYWWRSHWALIAGMVFMTAFNLVISYACYPDPWRRLRWDNKIAGEVFNFSGWILASGVIFAAAAQIDKLMVVKLFSGELAGIYALTLTIMMTLDRFMLSYFNRIYFAKTSSIVRETGATVESYYGPMLRIRLVFAFVAAAAIPLSPALVEVVFDNRYLQGGAFLSILFFRPLVTALVYPGEEYLISMKRMRSKFTNDVLRLIAIAVGAPLAFYQWGVYGLLWAVALQDVLRLFYIYWILYSAKVLSVSRELAYGLAIAAGAVVGLIGAYVYNALFSGFFT
ncbi:oligosaccharide flippase family protein [Parvularcula sp. LCG005]|uniref:oligosaccharide flippase family protein n=1 Tax=Parvularcula sp. LCG005 TaxID=3078805 RepID=UPI002943CBEE|nr:oligosaccharide flippase family protein [Parvularcula sp. LCG005]WOI53776.1 oligosaccharide flippase family protein [Parvularcula sp. LCG005]